MFASIWLDLSKIPANLLSLGALDFGMMVDGAVVMVENIVRHLSHRQQRRSAPNGNADAGRITVIVKSPAEAIREACHEVQRPVFYAIAIIITAYMPIFTLQRVEGRLFKPMAWTVAFALLGAMTYSILVAPVLSSLAVQQRRQGMAQPGDVVPDQIGTAARSRKAIEYRWVTIGVGIGQLRCGHVSHVQRHHRRGIPAASG